LREAFGEFAGSIVLDAPRELADDAGAVKPLTARNEREAEISRCSGG